MHQARLRERCGDTVMVALVECDLFHVRRSGRVTGTDVDAEFHADMPEERRRAIH